MLTIRRIYLYLVSAISLIAVSWAVIALIRLILDEGVGQGQITGLAWSLAVIIVGLPIFLFHWFIVQRLAGGSQEEQHSPVRTLFFFGVMAAGATPVLSNIYRLVDNLWLALLDGIRPDYYPYDLSVGEHLTAILVWSVIWVYLWRFVRDLSPSPSSPAQRLNLSIRRLYLLAFSLGGLVMVAWGSFGLLQTLMESLAGLAWRTPVANYTAQLLVGSGIWVGHWLIVQRDFARGEPAEERSVLRKIYLYLAVFVFSVAALSSGTLLLKRLLELALGAPPSGEPLLLQLSTAVPLLIVGTVFWAYHWSVLQEDAAQAPEAPRQAGVRRVYAYLVAAVGLSALLTGVGGLLTLLVEMATSAYDVGLDYFREMVALFVAMTLVGTPVWWLPWRAMQNLAVQPATAAGSSEAGPAERRSTVRKIYLYFFVFIASLAIFGSVGWFVFHILSAVLGADLPADFSTQVLNALVISALAIAVWLYHWWAIRLDGQLEEQDQASQLADVTVVVIDGAEGRLGQAVLDRLKDDLPGVRLKPVGLTPQATAAMAGQPLSAAALEMANFVIGSWQTLTTSEVAPLVAATEAKKLVVPVSNQDWIWTGVKPRSSEDYAEQISKGIRQALNGEDIRFDQGLEATTLVGIAIGGLVFLCLVSSLLGFVGRLL